SLGTGFKLGNNRFMTAAHNVADRPDIQLLLWNGDLVKASLLYPNRTEDVAILTVQESTASTPVAGLECSSPKVGTPVTAIGYPLGFGFTSQMKGYVASLTQKISLQDIK